MWSTIRSKVREYWLVWAFMFSFSGACFLGWYMVAAFVPSIKALYITYLLYAFSVIAALHFQFFLWNAGLKEENKKMSKRVPKYLEYAYALIISIGLLQIFIVTPRFVDYATVIWGDEDQILNDIKTEALFQSKSCGKEGLLSYPKDICVELQGIISSDTLKEHVKSKVVKNVKFVNYFASWDLYEQGPVPWSRGARIARLIQQFAFLQEATHRREEIVPSSRTTSVFVWIGMLLLPIGLGLRILKTSLELFIELA
jgi:hypothetical protein